MTFDFQQCDIPSPLAQFLYEWVYNSKVYNLFRVRVEFTAPPFPENIQYNQAISKYQ